MSHTARIFTQEQLTEALASACVQHEMHIYTRRAGFDIAGLNLRTVAKTMYETGMPTIVEDDE